MLTEDNSLFFNIHVLWIPLSSDLDNVYLFDLVSRHRFQVWSFCSVKKGNIFKFCCMLFLVVFVFSCSCFFVLVAFQKCLLLMPGHLTLHRTVKNLNESFTSVLWTDLLLTDIMQENQISNGKNWSSNNSPSMKNIFTFILYVDEFVF